MRTQIALMSIFAGLGLGITYIEILAKGNNKLASSLTDANVSEAENEPLVKVKGKSSAVSTDQYVNTFIIVEVLRNYSADRMEDAIEITFDENVITHKKVFGIMTEMSELINALRDTHSAEIIFEDYDLISLRLQKGEETFQLDIHFKEYSQKIEKMEYKRWE